MAINNVSFQNQANDQLNAIKSALDIATSVYGIKHAVDMDKYQTAQKQNEMQVQEQRNDPNSPESKLAQNQQGLLLDLASKNGIKDKTISPIRDIIFGRTDKALGPIDEQGIGPQDVVTPGATASSLDRNPIAASFLQSLIKNTANQNKLTIDLGKNDLTGQKIEAGKKIAEENNDTKLKVAAGKNDTALKVADTKVQGSPAIDKLSIATGRNYDSSLKDYVGLQNDINKVESIFDTKDKNGDPLITKQQLGDANAAIARIYSPGHMSDATVNRTEYESFPAIFKGALQKYSTNPTDIGSRSLIEHIIDQAHHLGNVSNQNAIGILNDIDSTYESVGNPRVKEAAQKKHEHYIERFSKVYPTMGGQNQQQVQPQTAQGVIPISSSQDQQYTPDVIDYAKSHNLSNEQALAYKTEYERLHSNKSKQGGI